MICIASLRRSVHRRRNGGAVPDDDGRDPIGRKSRSKRSGSRSRWRAATSCRLRSCRRPWRQALRQRRASPRLRRRQRPPRPRGLRRRQPLAAAAASAVARSLFLDARRCGDGRDGEVARDRRPDALRQRNFRNVQRVGDVEAGQVGDDPVGNGIRRADHRDAVADDVEHAAATDAWRGAFIDELHRHLDRDRRAGDDAQEVDVDRSLVHRIELEIAGDGADLLAGDIDRGDGRQKAAAVNLEEQLAAGQIDRDRRLLAAIDDGGDHALTTDCSGGPLAHLFADRRRELVGLAHRTTP